MSGCYVRDSGNPRRRRSGSGDRADGSPCAAGVVGLEEGWGALLQHGSGRNPGEQTRRRSVQERLKQGGGHGGALGGASI